MKDRVILFFCDISGTFSEDLQLKNNKSNYKQLRDLLEKRRKLVNADKVIFSIITSENNTSKMFKYMAIFEEFVSTSRVVLGSCFMQAQKITLKNKKFYIDNSVSFKLQDKIIKMKKYIEKTQNNYDVVEIDVADDFANETWIDNLKESSENINVNIFIPSHPKSLNPNVYTSFYTDITGLVDAIEKSIAPSTTFYDKDEKQDLKK